MPNTQDSPSRQNGDVGEKSDVGVNCVIPREEQGSTRLQNGIAKMALPPSGDEEPGSQKTSYKRMVHNAVERRRKVKINNYIHTLANLLPNKDGKRWSKNETLEKAVEYIKEIKDAHEKMMLGKLEEVQAREFKRMKMRIEELEQQNSTYVKLLEIAGIPANSEPNSTWWQSNKPCSQLNPELLAMDSNGEIVILDSDEKSKEVKCKKKSVKAEDKKVAPDSNANEKKSANSTISRTESSSHVTSGSWNTASGVQSGQQVISQNSMIIVSPPCLVPAPTPPSGEGSSQVGFPTQGVEKTVVTNMTYTTAMLNSQATNIITVTNSAHLTDMTLSDTGSSLPLQGPLIANTSSSITAVTQALSGAPIMSTSQSSSNIHQQPTVMPQVPMLNLGGTMSLMQPMITINDQGIPVLHMVAGPAPMGNGQVIVNGSSGQNLLLMGNSANSTGPARIGTNLNASNMNQQALHITGSAGINPSGISLECQTGQSQGLIQTDAAGLFQQTVCGGQLMGPTTQYLPNLHQLPPTSAPNQQMHMVAPSLASAQVISAQNNNVMIGPTIQGSQPNNTLLTVNSNTSTSTLPSALMLPNGQIIPVVREPSLLYQNSAPIGGSLLMATASPSVPQSLVPTSQGCQTQTNIQSLSGRTVSGNLGEINVESSSVSLPSVNLASLQGVKDSNHSQVTIAGLGGSTSNGIKATSNRPIPSATISVSSRTSSSSICSLGERPLTAQSDASNSQETAISTGTNSLSTSSTSTTAGSRTGVKSKKTMRSNQRTIKPKPVVSQNSSKVPKKPVSQTSSTHLSSVTVPKSNTECSTTVATTPSVLTTSVSACSASSLLTTLSDIEKLSQTSVASSVSAGNGPTKDNSANEKSVSKIQSDSRPSNAITDILAQATESIFASSISDMSSSPNPNYYGGNNNGTNSNGGHSDFLPNITGESESSDKISTEQQTFTPSMTLDTPEHDILSDSKDGGQNNCNVVLNIVTESQPCTKEQQRHNVDILSDLVGEVYSTVSDEHSLITSTTVASTSVTPTKSSSTFETSLSVGKVSPKDITTIRPIVNEACSNEDNNLGEILSSEVPSTSVLPNENMCNLGLALSEDEESVSVCKTKRVCENDIQLVTKRSRSEMPSNNSINELESTLKGSETMAKSQVESCAEDNGQSTTLSANSTELSMGGVTSCNTSVSFVSISQLASSATSAITTAATASLCTATFTNTMASTITSFTIDTAISNENSPLCSISPLLNSPNKSSDLAFTLGSTISEMPRVDESQFSTSGTPNSTVNGASVNPGLNSSTTNASFMALSSSFGLATSLSSPTSSANTCSTASSVPSSSSSSSSSSVSSLGSTFCMSELTSLNSPIVSNSQQNFRSLSYPGVVNLQGSTFSGLSNLHQGLGEPTSPSGTVPHSLSGKNQKAHSLHYGSRPDELRPQLLSLQVPDDGHHSHVSSQQNSTSTISSTHHSSGSLVANNELLFSTSPIAVQEGSSFCQPYATPHHDSQNHRAPVLNMNLPQTDINKIKSNQHRSHVSGGGDPRHHNDIMSPPAMSHPHIQRSSNSVHSVGHNQENMISGIAPPPQRQNQGYQSVQRIHSMNRQSPQGAGGNTPSPKIGDLHGHSPVSSQRMASSNSSTSPKPHLAMTQGQQLIRNHPVPSPGRNILLTPPASSPGTFLPRRSPNVSTGDTPIIMSYSSENLGIHNTFRDLNFPTSQKQLPHQPPISSGSSTLSTNRSTISYSAESLIQAQPSNHRPNCARESNSANSNGRLDVNHHSGNARSVSDSNPFIQGGSSSRPANNNDVQQQASFPYFTPFQQPLVDNLAHQPSMSTSLPQASNLKHGHAPSHTSLNKTCAMRGASEPSSQTIQSQPNFSFSLIQHQSVIGSGGADTQVQQQQHHHHHHHQQQQLSLHQGMVQDANPGVVRHNNYISMGNYTSHNHGQQSAAAGVSLQGPIHKDMQMPRPPPMPFMAPFHSNQSPGSQASNVRHTTTNSFLPQNAGSGLNSMPSFHESYPSPINSLRTDNSAGVPPVAGSNNNGGSNNSNNSTNTVNNNSTSSNVHSTDKGSGGNTSYKSRAGGATKQDGATSSKKSKQQSQHSKKKHQQYVEEEVNLSNSIFETGRSMTPYFTLPNLSPPRNEVPTYIPNPNPLFNPSQRGLTPNASQQPKTPDLGSPYTTPLFTPRTQSGLNLNFQAPGFGMNHLHSNGGMPNQITPHGGGVNVTSHVPNFNLSNIFPDINNSNESIGITPIKFHGNHILPPPQPGMDHNLQHHQSAGSLYHKRAHPPPVIHNGMTINSLLSHNPHGFDGRPQVPMGINNTMAPPFHGHSHTPSFSNVIPTLNFSMHDH